MYMSTKHMKIKPRIFAYYLPQYHPFPENDEWWGKGFTEWTNVARARKLFPGHDQPHIPADLGFYDLRMPEVREEQAQNASSPIFVTPSGITMEVKAEQSRNVELLMLVKPLGRSTDVSDEQSSNA